MFKVIICGSREFDDYDLLKEKCDKILKRKVDSGEDIVIVSGAAKGADSLGEKYAKERGYKLEKFPANWEKYGKRAGYLRNKQMATVSNACIAFLSAYGENIGTKMMISIAKEDKLLLRVIDENKYEEGKSK